jgi:hypothetical protein
MSMFFTSTNQSKEQKEDLNYQRNHCVQSLNSPTPNLHKQPNNLHNTTRAVILLAPSIQEIFHLETSTLTILFVQCGDLATSRVISDHVTFYYNLGLGTLRHNSFNGFVIYIYN